ncbi:hypothetical protein PAXINDRAFT_7993 [Paxillus involutus ATCC 200175]|nr:hypothetical protein PAXINDRAFT_7993 [Paxillus involutus ATCC 200175]
MPPTRTIANTHIAFNVGDLPIPCSHCSHRPPSYGLMAEYVAYTKECRNTRDLTLRLEENSPLLDSYSALLQNHCISNVIKFIERTNHCLNSHDWVVSTLKHIQDKQQELLINILHQMNFNDLVFNINRHHQHHHQGPLDRRNNVPLSDSPSSESEVPSSPNS